jgi:hypothetical protein
MATQLDPTGRLVTLSPSVRLRTPGLHGSAEAHRPVAGAGETTRAFRAVERSTPELERALANEHVTSQATVELSGTREVPAAAAAPTRSTPAGEPAIELQVAAPGEEFGQLVLSVDESGVTTWNFARLASGEVAVTRGAEPRIYLIPRYVAPAPAPEAAAERSLFSAVGKKLLKVLVFPLVDPLIGEIGEHYAHRWEERKRPYRLRSFTPADYAHPDGTPIEGERWQQLAAGPRALLMIHGTFSRASTAFAGLPQNVVARLHQVYGGRVFAFDHFTLSESPEQNVQWLFERIPDGTHLNLDIICHSRGALVSRELSEKQAHFSLGGRQLRVGRIVFVAAANAGTPLADSKYMGDFIDSYTNLLQFFPTNGATEVLEGLVTVAKMLAVGVLHGLPGLQAMNPGGPFLEDFNQGPKGADRYFALASNYDPKDPGLKAWAVNRLVARIFQNAGNDLVVPTLGVYAANGSGYFPIAGADTRVFGPERGIWHGGFFSEPDAYEKIVQWLSASL